MTFTLGIDPGASNGGLVVIKGTSVQDSLKMPQDPLAVHHFLSQWEPFVSQCCIEQIPKWCGPGQAMGAAASAVLYGNYQLCVGMWVALTGEMPRLLAPIKWQNAVACRNTTHLPRDPWKRKLRDHAQTIFKQTKVTMWMADALLIARAGDLLT